MQIIGALCKQNCVFDEVYRTLGGPIHINIHDDFLPLAHHVHHENLSVRAHCVVTVTVTCKCKSHGFFHSSLGSNLKFKFKPTCTYCTLFLGSQGFKATKQTKAIF